MPGQTTTTLVKQGAFDADLMNALNTQVTNLVSQSPGIIGTPINNAAVPFGNYTTAGTAVTVLASGHAAGTYRVSVYAVVTTTFVTAASVGHFVSFTDDQGARTGATTNTSALTAGGFATFVQVLRSTGATAITVTEVAGTSNATAGAMALSAFVERIV